MLLLSTCYAHGLVLGIHREGLSRILGKTRVLEHKICETTTVALITTCLRSGWWDLLNQGMIHNQDRMEWDGLKFHHTCRMAQNLKHELFVSGIFI